MLPRHQQTHAETGFLPCTQFMPQWFTIPPEFSEISVPFRKNSIELFVVLYSVTHTDLNKLVNIRMRMHFYCLNFYNAHHQIFFQIDNDSSHKLNQYSLLSLLYFHCFIILLWDWNFLHVNMIAAVVQSSTRWKNYSFSVQSEFFVQKFLIENHDKAILESVRIQCSSCRMTKHKPFVT